MAPAHFVGGASPAWRGTERKRLIVLSVVIAVQVAQRKAVVADDIIDRIPRFTTTRSEKVVGPSEPGRERSRRGLNDAELILRGAHRITKAIVPFGPAYWELALFLTICICRVWLRDEVHARPSRRRPGGQFAHRAIEN